MNNRQLAQVGLGLLGVWALVIAVSGFMNAIGNVGVMGGLPLILLLGVYLLVPAIPATISTIIAVVSARQAQGSWAAGFEITRFIDHGIRIAIALYLIVRPDRLLDFLRRQRPEPVG